MTGNITIADGLMRVTPPRYPSRECRDAGGSWNKTTQTWDFPAYTLYLEVVRELYPGIPEDPSVAALEPNDEAMRGQVDTWKRLIDRNGAASPLQTSFAKLYPYQREAVARLLSDQRDGQMLALSPGLGKTAVSLISAAIAKKQRVLIVAPLSLLNTWKKEADFWIPFQKIAVMHGDVPAADGWTITNYDTVVNKIGLARDGSKGWKYDRAQNKIGGGWDLVILDESVLIKNRTTKRFQAMKALRKTTAKIWLLSGSPVTRHMDDMYGQLHVIAPTAFTSYWRFTERYCHIQQTAFGTSIVGTRDGYDAKHDLRDTLFVRNQKDVLPDLPEYIYKTVEVDMVPAQRKAHDEMKEHFITQLEDGDKLSATVIVAQLIRMQQITSGLSNVNGGAYSAKADALESMIEGDSVELPMIVWTQWVPNANSLLKRLRAKFPHFRVEIINGEYSKTVNDQHFLEYKEGKIDILILALAVGKFGHTLTNTRTVVYFDKSWAADDYVQSLARVKRIGLTHSPLCVTLKCTNSVDELVERNLANKMPAIASISNADLATFLRGLGG